MSLIDDLLAKHCPDGVPLKPLSEVGVFVRGNGMQKSDLISEGFSAIHYGQVHTFYGTSASKTISFVTPQFAARLRRAQPGDLIIATTSEDDEAVGKAVAWIGEDEVAVSGDAYIYRHSLDPLYVAYFFQTATFRAQKKRHINGTKVRRLSGESLGKIKIPVPPIDMQRQLAEIIATMEVAEAALEAELKAELLARRHQYEHYRDVLLTFEEPADE